MKGRQEDDRDPEVKEGQGRGRETVSPRFPPHVSSHSSSYSPVLFEAHQISFLSLSPFPPFNPPPPPLLPPVFSFSAALCTHREMGKQSPKARCLFNKKQDDQRERRERPRHI